MKTQRPLTGRFDRVATEEPAPGDDLDELDDDEETRRRRPWFRVLVAVIAAIIAIHLAGQTAARMWLEDLDERLLDAGAGTNAAATVLEREHLEAFRSIAFSEGFAEDLAGLAVRAIEEKITPIDANHSIPMIDVIDTQGRVVFAFRGEGALRPIYRERRGIDMVVKSLDGERDEYGERFTDLIATDEGPLVATAGPVRQAGQEGRIVGALLLMTPLDELLGSAKNLHGSELTAYSFDEGAPLATTTPVRPRGFTGDLLTRLNQTEHLPHASNLDVAGSSYREQLGVLDIRHRPTALLGVSLPDRSREVAFRVMLVVAIGVLVVAALVATAVRAWSMVEREVEPPPAPPRAELPRVTGSSRQP